MLLAIFLLSTLCKISAQEKNASSGGDPVIISIVGGAHLYSQDKDFNNLISENNVTVNGHIASHHNRNGIHSITISQRVLKKDSRKNFALQVRDIVRKKEDLILRKARQRIAKYEQQRLHHLVEIVETSNYSGYSVNSNRISQSAFVSNIKSQDFSKIFTTQYRLIVKYALDTLHPQKYNFYNSRSLDFCFTAVFCVRPPPVLA